MVTETSTLSLYTTTITLILVMDPLGNIPLFMSILKSYSSQKQASIIIRESIVAYCILILFLFLGKYILQSFDMTLPALSTSGGIILFLIALNMIFPSPHAITSQTHTGPPFIVPLAIPFTAGPSALTTVSLFANTYHDPLRLCLAITIACVLFCGIMLCSRYLMTLLGDRGITAMERLMGMILMTLAIQMLLSGIHEYWAALP
ncbi:MAG: hypothetical protein A3J38_02790 [Gammaproteobacteria bacterium RIFCSPHIGHO2_12_FULL_45_9]|nr:MAG: hypothetical protein A3J38_02790 [Gammaproteobacteria bacterium RIFCSPHIGHO2_12_FULL_45_9]